MFCADAHNSLGSADSVKNYDYCRTRNRREISEAAGRSGGFVLRRRVRQPRTGDSCNTEEIADIVLHRASRHPTRMSLRSHTRSLANLEFRRFLWENYQKRKRNVKVKRNFVIFAVHRGISSVCLSVCLFVCLSESSGCRVHPD